MKILMLAHITDLSGASQSMLDLMDALSNQHTFFVAVPDSDGALIDELKKRNICFRVCRMRYWLHPGRNGMFLVRCKQYAYGWFLMACRLRALKKFAEEKEVDLIHTNSSVLSMGCALQKATKLPHVFHVREFGQEDFDFKYVCSQEAFYRAIDTYTTTVVAISRAVQHKFAQNLPNANVTLVYNGVNAKNLDESRIYEQKKECSFLIAGSLHPSKGQDIAMKAAECLVNRGIFDFKLYIAGSGKPENSKAIYDCKLPQVECVGQIADMPAFRKAMDVALVCSKCEAFGRVTVEAMMSGMPVIGANTGGTVELIEDDVNGYLYERNDAQALADKMQYFIEHPEEIERLGKNARDYAAEHFSVARCAQEIHAVYTSAKEQIKES